MGLEDPVWGERVCAALILHSGEMLTLNEIRTWGKEKFAPYKVPSRILILESLPRNPLGKITKPALRRLFESASA